jgi:hypothetical protein
LARRARSTTPARRRPSAAEAYGHLVISGSGTKTLAANATVAGNLTVSAGTFDTAGFSVNRTSAGGTLSVSNGATLRIGGTASFPANYATRSPRRQLDRRLRRHHPDRQRRGIRQPHISGSGTKTLAAVATSRAT